jgi:tetratricopeptide (TPR) repeat protein
MSVLRKMMAKRPEDRYQTPAEVVAALAPYSGAAISSPVLANQVTGVMTDPARPAKLEPALSSATEMLPLDAKSRPEMPSKARVRLVLLGCGLLVLVVVLCVAVITLVAMNSGGVGTVAIKRTARTPSSQDYQQAEEHNRRALARNPKEFDVAIADLGEAIELAPDKAEYYANRGRRYTLRGQENNDKSDYDKAIVDFTEAIRLAPKMADYWNERGWAYLNKEDWIKALADIEEAIRWSPNSASCYSNRGWAYKLKGDYAAALLDLNKAIELDSRHAPAYQLRGDVNLQQKEYDRALADYTQAIQIDHTYAAAYIGRGQTYMKGAKVLKETYVLNRATEDLNRAILLQPNNAKSYLIRSEIYSNLGDKAKSEADRAEAIRRDPSLAKDKK